MATHADFEKAAQRRQELLDEANDTVPCWGECGDTASVADGWYLDNGQGPYCETCYDRITEPPDAEDVGPNHPERVAEDEKNA